MTTLKKYPSWAEFDSNSIGYGFAAGGIGVYTYDRKYFWPDPECSTEGELDAFREKLTKAGYEIPNQYRKDSQ